jgi:hypothetical protein
VPGPREPFGDLACGAGLDGAHVDVGTGRREVLQHAVRAERDGADVRGVGQHRDHHVGAPDRLGDAGHDRYAQLGRALAAGGAAAERPHLMSGADQVGRHRPPHHAEPDKAHDCHTTELPRPLIYRLITATLLAIQHWPEEGYFDIPVVVNADERRF